MSSIINTKCGELTVISDKYKKDSDIYYCKVKCSCGKVKEMQIYRIINRVSKSCGCIGVSWNKKGKVWEAYISKNKIRIPLGKFDDLQKAILTRKEAELKYYGFNK